MLWKLSPLWIPVDLEVWLRMMRPGIFLQATAEAEVYDYFLRFRDFQVTRAPAPVWNAVQAEFLYQVLALTPVAHYALRWFATPDEEGAVQPLAHPSEVLKAERLLSLRRKRDSFFNLQSQYRKESRHLDLIKGRISRGRARAREMVETGPPKNLHEEVAFDVVQDTTKSYLAEHDKVYNICTKMFADLTASLDLLVQEETEAIKAGEMAHTIQYVRPLAPSILI